MADASQSESILAFLNRLFTADFMPHGHCFFWRPDILWLHVVSDAFIALAYFSIPLMLLHFRKKRRDLPYPWMFALFAGFIFWCGATHIMNIVTFWNPVYRVEGLIKLVTAFISVLTAVLLFPLIPQALSLRSAKELEEKNQELEAAYKAVVAQRAKADHEKARRQEVEQFAYIASHDLREPLRTIGLFTDMLKKTNEGKLDKETEGYLGFIVNAASRMNVLISDLVTYSVLESKEPVREKTSLRDCLVKATDNLSVALKEKGAIVMNEISRDAIILGVPSQIIQVFQNLIANGVKFQFEGRKPEIKVAVSQVEGSWVVTVTDNGIGFHEQYKDRIFQVFKRLHSSEAHYRGTGMGLAICKRIIEQHGGEIWANSTEGKGSTFSFSIPTA